MLLNQYSFLLLLICIDVEPLTIHNTIFRTEPGLQGLSQKQRERFIEKCAKLCHCDADSDKCIEENQTAVVTSTEPAQYTELEETQRCSGARPMPYPCEKEYKTMWFYHKSGRCVPLVGRRNCFHPSPTIFKTHDECKRACIK